MNNDMEVIPVCEGLPIAKRLDVYSFIINAYKSMEPRFNLWNINIIMADQLITDSLLDTLDIRETCVLCRDQYHLFKKNFLRSSREYGQYCRNMLLKCLMQKLK